MKFLFFIALIPLLAGCSDLRKGDQLEDLHALQKRIKSYSRLLEEHRLTDVLELSSSAVELVTYIERNDDDTISLERALKYDHFMRLNIILESSENAQKELEDLVVEEQHILEKLRLDISQGRGSRHEYDAYIAHERDKVDWLDSIVKFTTDQWIEVGNNFENLVIELRSMSFD